MVKTSLVHVKFEYLEAREARKKILYSQMDTVKTLQYMNNYINIRKEELKLRVKLNQKFSELSLSIRKLKEQLPASQLPNTLRKKEEIKKEVKEKSTFSQNIQDELSQIKRKLEELE